VKAIASVFFAVAMTLFGALSAAILGAIPKGDVSLRCGKFRVDATSQHGPWCILLIALLLFLIGFIIWKKSPSHRSNTFGNKVKRRSGRQNQT
jgi:H+/Cl- antiporter ClcA